MFFVWLSVQIYSIFPWVYVSSISVFLDILPDHGDGRLNTFSLFETWSSPLIPHTFTTLWLLLRCVQHVCMYIFERLYNHVYCYLEWYRVVWTYMHNLLYASCIIGIMHHWIDLCITEYIMHHWMNFMHHWTDWCITEYIYASLNELTCITEDVCITEYIYASLSWLVHHWIYYA